MVNLHVEASLSSRVKDSHYYLSGSIVAYKGINSLQSPFSAACALTYETHSLKQ